MTQETEKTLVLEGEDELVSFSDEQKGAIVALIARRNGESRRDWTKRVAETLGIEEEEIEPSEKKRSSYTPKVYREVSEPGENMEQVR